MSEKSTADTWQTRAKGIANRFNFAWFLEKLSLPLLLAGLTGSCLVLLARREFEAFPWTLALIITAGILAFVFLVSWLIARSNFTTQKKALVRIESSMALDNRLTAADDGIAPWPEVPEEIDDGTRWNWTRLLIPPVATLLILSAAFLLPISAKTDPNATPPEEPANRQSLQASIDQLREDNAINEDYLDEMQEKIDELREKPAEEWFDHSSLEATDTLKNSHEQELKEVERNLRKAERALNALQKHGENMGQTTRDRLLNEFDQALKQMGEGGIKPNKDLLDQLKGLDPGQLKGLNQEQLDQLRENMREAAKDMQDANGGEGGQNEEWLDELLQEGGDPG